MRHLIPVAQWSTICLFSKCFGQLVSESRVRLCVPDIFVQKRSSALPARQLGKEMFNTTFIICKSLLFWSMFFFFFNHSRVKWTLNKLAGPQLGVVPGQVVHDDIMSQKYQWLRHVHEIGHSKCYECSMPAFFQTNASMNTVLYSFLSVDNDTGYRYHSYNFS